MIRVVVFTCDCSRPNKKAWKELGMSGKLGDMKNYILFDKLGKILYNEQNADYEFYGRLDDTETNSNFGKLLHLHYV